METIVLAAAGVTLAALRVVVHGPVILALHEQPDQHKTAHGELFRSDASSCE
jgi:hypothetical protein